MNLLTLREQFARIGARVMVEPAREMFGASHAVRLEVRSDRKGEYFHLMVDPLRIVGLAAMDVRPNDGYLVLVSRQREFGEMREAPRRMFVCGRSGQSLFVRTPLSPPVQRRVRHARPAPARQFEHSMIARHLGSPRRMHGHRQNTRHHQDGDAARSRP